MTKYKNFNRPNPNNPWTKTAGYYKPTNPEKYIGDTRKIQYRSQMELKFYKMCDESPKIKRWAVEENFMRVRYPHPWKKDVYDKRKPKISNYYPDGYVEIDVGEGVIKKYLIEIKPKEMLKPPPPLSKNATRKQHENRKKKLMQVAVNIAKYNAAKTFAAKKGWKYIFLTDSFFGKIV